MTSAQLSGPITGGAHGWPMGATLRDFAALGYAEEEFFLEGSAPTYRSRSETVDFDGRWDVETVAELPFRTRMLVRRPLDPAHFNGTVLLVWSNVSMGCDMFTHDTAEITEGGFAVVVVSAQAVGVHGFTGPTNLGLTAWDPERYGSLHIDSDDASYGIFSAAAALVGPARDVRSLDPLAGLKVERIIATGSSQSAARLHTYWNAIHPREAVFDAFLLDVHFGWSAPLASPHHGRPADLAGAVSAFQPVSMLRDDADIPLFVVNTETEALTFFPVRRSDTDRFRFWEAAGATHAPLQSMQGVVEKFRRDWGMTIETPTPAMTPNDMDTAPLRDAAIHQLHRWLTTRKAPSSMPPIELTAEPPTICRDDHGIAQGGIRLPQVAVPVATLRGSSDTGSPLASLSGSSEPFSGATLRTLYASGRHYLEQVESAIASATSSGFLLERDATRIREQAAGRAAAWSTASAS